MHENESFILNWNNNSKVKFKELEIKEWSNKQTNKHKKKMAQNSKLKEKHVSKQHLIWKEEILQISYYCLEAKFMPYTCTHTQYLENTMILFIFFLLLLLQLLSKMYNFNEAVANLQTKTNNHWFLLHSQLLCVDYFSIFELVGFATTTATREKKTK